MPTITPTTPNKPHTQVSSTASNEAIFGYKCFNRIGPVMLTITLTTPNKPHME
jgi:hypothetical protein